MDLQQQNEIKFKVESENIINNILNYSIPLLNEVLKPYLNKKVLKQDLDILKEIEIKTDDILNKTKDKFKDISVIYLKTYCYNIILRIQLRFNDDKNFFYYEGYKYLCSIENRIIKSFYDFKPLEQINLKEQLEIFNNCLILKEQLEKEKENLKPYDLKYIRGLK